MGCLMVLVQKWPLFQHFFLQNIVPEKFFYGIVQRKNAVLAYKSKKFKKSKNSHFSKVVKRWFWSKNGHSFKPFFFCNTGQQNVFYDILQRKTPFQAIKTKSSNSRKIDIFPKGLTHGFGPIMATFPNFFFQAIQARIMSFTIFYNEKTPF